MLGALLAIELGIGIGLCDIQGEFPACDNGGWVAHVYGKADVWQRGNWSAGLEYNHYSYPEKSDLDYSGGSGAFDYGGVYIRWRK